MSIPTATACTAYVTVAPSARAACSALGASDAAAVATPGRPEGGSSHIIIAEDTTVAETLPTPSITHRDVSCENPIPTTTTALGVPQVATRRGVTARTAPGSATSIDSNTRASDTNADARVIVGITRGALTLIPTVTHTGILNDEGAPPGVAHVTVARRGDATPPAVSLSSARPGSTTRARTVTVPKRHTTPSESALPELPVPRNRVTDAPPCSGATNVSTASRRGAVVAVSTFAAAASVSGAPRHALQPTACPNPNTGPSPLFLACVTCCVVEAVTRNAPKRSAGVSQNRIAEDTHRAPASADQTPSPPSPLPAVP
mmetsp:Transcript_5943/g.19763  ORF Transcript_5943/g.19763 Transcript_5943/m.19763 type:complete len:317 (-) Transcript_5943:988-1938(-)